MLKSYTRNQFSLLRPFSKRGIYVSKSPKVVVMWQQCPKCGVFFFIWSIHCSLFVLVNLVFSHALFRTFEMHKEFFIWLNAPSLSQPQLNSWVHHDLDIEPYLQFFSYSQTLKILKLHGLTHKLEHGFLWVPCKNSIFISSSRSYHIHLLKLMVLMPKLNVYLNHHNIQPWFQHMNFKHYL
jgi:hypothetical protein